MGYQPGTNILEDVNGNHFADYNTWTGGRISSTSFWIYIAFMKLYKQKCIYLGRPLGIGQIPKELIQGGNELRCEDHELIKSV